MKYFIYLIIVPIPIPIPMYTFNIQNISIFNFTHS